MKVFQNLEKCICFVKVGTASQLHAGNFDDAITCLDWSDVLPHASMFIRWEAAEVQMRSIRTFPVIH